MGVAGSHVRKVPQLFDRARHRSMLVGAVVDQIPGDPRRAHHRGHAHTELGEVEIVVVVRRVGDRIPRRHSSRWLHVVIKPAALVVPDNQHARVPHRRIADRLIDTLYKSLAMGDVIKRVLRVAALVGTAGDVIAIIGLDEDVVGDGSVREVFLEVVHVVEMRCGGGNVHPRQRHHLRKRVAVIHRPVDVLRGHQVIDCAVVEQDAADELVDGAVPRGGAIVQAGGGCGVDRTAGWARSGRASRKTSDRISRIRAPAP